MKIITIKYFDKDLEHISINKNGDWIDLRASDTITLDSGDSKLIPLGVGMILPKGYEAHIVPRSSTFKNYGIIQTNHQGVVDNSYSGDEDEWKFPAYATRKTIINKGDRICQFRIIKRQPRISLNVVEKLNKVSRGGFGSSGTK